MKFLPLAAGVVLTCSALIGVPAHAQPSRDLYMVKDVAVFNEDCAHGYPCKTLSYSGSFYVLRQKGATVAGQMGFLHYTSDNMCLTGTVKGGKYRFVAHRGKEQPYNFHGRWTGAGEQQHVKGYQPVTRQQLQAYMMGRDPKSLIDKCVKC